VRDPGAIQVLSCYELGHQPIAVASAVAFLERAGFRPAAADLAVEPLERVVERACDAPARLVLISVPMHTALHIGGDAARSVREALPAAHVCFFGLYAALNAEHLLCVGAADSIVSGEVEPPLVALAQALEDGRPLDELPWLSIPGRKAPPHLERVAFAVPARAGLPGPERYARLVRDGVEVLAAAVEASRGCRHRCRHCPIPPIYGGRFFVVPRDIVLEDVRGLVARGVRHVTFADPDFLNGPRHALAVIREIHAEFPELTFDVTTKIEHVLRHRRVLPELAACGCVFLVSAVESLSDVVLEHLDKNHRRADVFEAQRLLADVGIALRPSLLPFTPWSTLTDYFELLDWIRARDLVAAVDPVQLSIRLLVPPGSLLASYAPMQRFLGPLVPDRFSYAWVHPDPRMDELQSEVARIAADAARESADPDATFERVWTAAEHRAGRMRKTLPTRVIVPPRPIPPRLTEPWFC
jgi:radical SAM superfamily enzyme YgiQ (UPF0313 family)